MFAFRRVSTILHDLRGQPIDLRWSEQNCRASMNHIKLQHIDQRQRLLLPYNFLLPQVATSRTKVSSPATSLGFQYLNASVDKTQQKPAQSDGQDQTHHFLDQPDLVLGIFSLLVLLITANPDRCSKCLQR